MDDLLFFPLKFDSRFATLMCRHLFDVVDAEENVEEIRKYGEAAIACAIAQKHEQTSMPTKSATIILAEAIKEAGEGIRCVDDSLPYTTHAGYADLHDAILRAITLLKGAAVITGAFAAE